MTTPGISAPDGSFVLGSEYGQDITEESAKVIMKGGVLDTWSDTQEAQHTQVTIDSPLWKTLDGNEESTFPRSNLSFGAASSTSSGGSGDNSHSHSMGRIPDYQPAGNFLEIGFIKVQTHCVLNAVGFITGDSATWFDIGSAYIAVYKMDDITGDLSRIWTSGDIKSAATEINTETRIPVPDVSARQGETYAVAVVTHTSGLQQPGSLICTTLTDISRGSTASSTYPRKPYGYYGSFASGPPPVTIAESSINYGSSTKLPFFFLRRAVATGV